MPNSAFIYRVILLPGEVRDQIRGWLGQSCHTNKELQTAQNANCNYVTLSPIFPPVSKPNDPRESLGAKELAIRSRMFQIPIFALGGITADLVEICNRTGCHGIASMGTIFPPNGSPEDTYQATRLLVDAYLSNS